MAASATMIARLRRMVAEPTTVTYSDADLTTAIERYPLPDDSLIWPRQPTDAGWTATYDLNAAAADVWSEKASVVAQDFDFSADGGSYTRSQVYEQYRRQAAYYNARKAIGHIEVEPWPRPLSRLSSTTWQSNQPEIP
jgi:hypothetical protein